MNADPRIETNRKNWNERTPVHAKSDFYDVAALDGLTRKHPPC